MSHLTASKRTTSRRLSHGCCCCQHRAKIAAWCKRISALVSHCRSSAMSTAYAKKRRDSLKLSSIYKLLALPVKIVRLSLSPAVILKNLRVLWLRWKSAVSLRLTLLVVIIQRKVILITRAKSAKCLSLMQRSTTASSRLLPPSPKMRLHYKSPT